MEAARKPIRDASSSSSSSWPTQSSHFAKKGSDGSRETAKSSTDHKLGYLTGLHGQIAVDRSLREVAQSELETGRGGIGEDERRWRGSQVTGVLIQCLAKMKTDQKRLNMS